MTNIIITPSVHLIAAPPMELVLATLYLAADLQGSAQADLARAFTARLTDARTADLRRDAGFE